MIVETLFEWVLSFLLFFIPNLPNLPADTLPYIDQYVEYLVSGAGILANYAPLNYLLILAGIIVAVDSFIGIYKFVMWIIRKLPFSIE